MEERQENSVCKATEIGSPTPDFNQRVVLATREPKLLYVKDIRTAWKQLIAKINILLGGTDQTLPTTEELEIMIKFALDNWYGLSLSDIELSVNANISRKTEEFIQFYGKVSVSYLQSCISNYQDVRRKAILDHNRRQESEKPRAIQEPEYITNAKLYDGLNDFIRTQKRFPEFWDWNGVYKHMEDNHLIDHISNDHKKWVYEEVKAELTGDRITKRMEARTLGDMAGADGLNAKDRIRKECRRRIIESVLTPLIH